MTAADALYQSILANPDDDLPRLVYADWLDENGQANTAAFIRVQCELARVPTWHPLAVRSRFRPSWWLTGRGKSPPTAATPRGFRWNWSKYRRGFPCRVQVQNPVTAARYFDALHVAAPVDDIQLWSGTSNTFAPLVTHPRMAAVRRLTLGPYLLTGEQIRPLVESPYATGITDLDFSHYNEPQNALRAVLQSPLAAGLTRLHTSGYRYDPPDDALAEYEGTDLPRLEEFDFRRARSVATVRRVLDSAHLPRLERLNLERVPLGAEGVRDLAGWPGCERVTVLDLRETRLKMAAARGLAAGRWAGLRELNLRHNDLGPRAVRMLTDAEWFAGLRVLDLHANRVGDGGATALANAAGGLLALDLTFAHLTDVGAKALLDSPHLGGLVHLNLQLNDLSDGVKRAVKKRFGAAVVL